MNDFNSNGNLNPLSGEYENNHNKVLHVGNQSVKYIEQNPPQSESGTVSESSGCGSHNINSGQTNQGNGSALARGEHYQKSDGKTSQEVPSFEQPIEDDTFDYDQTEFNDAIKSEMANLEVLLKDLYTEVDPRDVLSDQELNEDNLKEFFKKYPQSKTDTLAVTLAGFYLALDDVENAKKNLARIRNPDLTDDNNENASYHRAYYIMKANLEIEAKHFKKALESLKQCWDIPQGFFSNGQEDLLDYYATSLGRIHLKEGNLKEAEKCFKDALAIRRQNSSSPRLISSSYNDLALIYIQKANGTGSAQADSEHALQYLNKAFEYDRIFNEELKSNEYKKSILLGQVDFKRPKLAKTEEAYKKLPKS